MKESFQKRSNNLVNFMRELGYEPDRDNSSDDFGFHRSIRRDKFPRFHLYVEEKGDSWIFKLHLDQKRASYGNQNAHSGEYDSPLVRKEMKRIKSIVKATN
ncbi:MAG: hypothetical protein ABEI53_01590 [Candidatus Magasanikbacteria bacterium]